MVAEAASSIGPGLTRYAWIVALLPFVSAPLILFFGRRTPGKGWIYGVLSVGAGFLLSLGILWHFVLPFEAVSFLLLAALIGAVVLARRDDAR